jgi:replicative DNA helicase
LLGALLHQNACRDRCEDLKPEQFYDSEYGRLFARITERIDAGRNVSAVSLKHEFDNELLSNVLASMVGLIQVPELAGVIAECAARRELIDICQGLVTQMFAGDPVPTALSSALARIDVITGAKSDGRSVKLSAALDDAIAAIDIARGQNGPTGLSTGFRDIDYRIGGLEPGTLTVIAGRPAMGKSALALQWGINAARNGAGVLMISLEMSARELGRRVLSTAAGVPIKAMKYGTVDLDQAARIVTARRELGDLPLTIDDGAGLTVRQIAARARAARRNGLGLVVVDHLHIVRPEESDAKQGPTWAMGRISGAMKRLAKDCEVPVLVAAQLNRGVEGREDKRPGLGDLRQAGDIEQDADAVGFVYRPEYYLSNEPERQSKETNEIYANRCTVWATEKKRLAGVAEVIWGKVRDGESGTDRLRFDGATTTFSGSDAQ